MKIDGYLKENKDKFVEQIMILVCKEDEELFNELFSKDWELFYEPLVFSYFNQKNRNKKELRLLFSGCVNFEPLLIEPILLENNNSVYFPKFGYLEFNFDKLNNLQIESKNGEVFFNMDLKSLNFNNKGKKFIGDHCFELLYQPVRLLRQCYYDSEGNILDVEIIDHNSTIFQDLNIALNLIRNHVPDYYELLRIVLKKIVVFKIDSTLRNSFADLAAHGVIFINAYQLDYDVVFFVDDIAHQAGHVIMNTLLFDKSDYFNVHYDTTFEEITYDSFIVEKRNLHVVFHALYTYYTAFTCLDACLKAGVFNKRQTHEALGRIKFYILKCAHDLALINQKSVSMDNSIPLFTCKGKVIIEAIKQKQLYMIDLWWSKIGDFNLDNQPYNFTYSCFSELNSLDDF
jgi:hypothetical protein